jgi:hypothetical protein
MKGEIGLIDSFRLCNIYMNIYPDGGNVKPQPERNFSIEKDLITMYQVKEVGLMGGVSNSYKLLINSTFL